MTLANTTGMGYMTPEVRDACLSAAAPAVVHATEQRSHFSSRVYQDTDVCFTWKRMQASEVRHDELFRSSRPASTSDFPSCSSTIGGDSIP